MATCPRCGGFLGEKHRCRGLWRRWGKTAGWFVIGAGAGYVFSFMLTEGPAPPELIITCTLLGAVLVSAVRHTLSLEE
jgi:putative flippase GtrA